MEKVPDKRFQTTRWLIFGILALAYFLVYFHRLSLSVVADDLIRELKTTAGLMGLLGSVYFYCYALMQIPAGLLADSFGPRKTVTCSLLLAAAGSVVFGLAQEIEAAFLGRILVGFGVSAVFIPTMKILSQWFKADEFASMAGLLNAVGGAGVLAATWALALMTGLFGWRSSFILIGLGTFALAGLVWLIVRDRPSARGFPDLVKSRKHGSRTGSGPDDIGLWQGFCLVLGNRYFWPVAIWFFFDCGIFFAFGALWGGPYLMHVYALTRGQAGGILSMIAWGMIVGSPLLGLVSDRVLKSRKKVIVLCSSILVLEFVFLCLFPGGLPRPALYGLFFVFSLCASSIVAIGFTTTKELFPVNIAGTSVGLVNLFPFLGGAIFMPILGKVLDLYPKTTDGGYPLQGYTVVLVILLGAAVAALICALLMKETYPSGEREGRTEDG
ncbi:MAG: MFS transporter [Desulfohalobiaceae bacterium]|nr:MFS transporter [Desulfohalobiaceae bacterium]